MCPLEIGVEKMKLVAEKILAHVGTIESLDYANELLSFTTLQGTCCIYEITTGLGSRAAKFLISVTLLKEENGKSVRLAVTKEQIIIQKRS